MKSEAFRWHMIPGSPYSADGIAKLHNATYSHWKALWSEILDIGSALTSESFLRQSILCPLVLEGGPEPKIAGLIACSFFDPALEAFKDHPYLKAFPTELLERQKRISQAFMSIEYLSVHEEFRKSIVGLSLADVLLALSMKIFAQSGADFVLGTARSANHVDERCFRLGFQAIGEINKFGHPCTLILNEPKTLCPHPDLRVRTWVEDLWNRRNDRSILSIGSPAKPQAA